jgi:signal transduction histidine kinase
MIGAIRGEAIRDTPQVSWTRRVLLPPVFDDARRTSTARLNHWLAITILAANVLSVLALTAVLPSHAGRFVTLVAAVVGVCIVSFALNRAGRQTTAAWLLVIGLWVVGTVSAWTAGGLTNTALASLIVLVAAGGVMLGWRTGLVLAAVGVLTTAAVAYAGTSGMLPEPALVQTAWVRAIWLSDFIVITAVAMVLFAQDLTGARDRALAGMSEIVRSEQAMRAVMDNAPFGVHMYRLDDDRLVFVGYNRKAEEMLELDHTQLLGKTLEEAFPGNIGTDTPAEYRRVARGGAVYDLDQYAYDAGDIAGIFEVHAFNFGPDRVSVFFRDVTSKRMAEQALRDANAMLAVAQHAAGAGFWSWDVPARELSWTPEFYHLFGLPNDVPATFDTWRATLHPDDAASAEAAIQASVDAHVPLDNEYRILLPDGSVRWIGARGTTTYGEDGEPRRMSGICIDIGEKKRRDDEIRALNADLERRVEERTRELSVANRELQDFVYSASHDLRSPLRALDGFSEVLLEDCSDVLGEKDLGYLHRIRAASQHMAELIDALLGLSRVGRREVDLHMVDLSAAARAILDELADTEPEREVSVSIEPELQARTDEALADIVLRNLLGNAWKFTSKKETASIEVGSVRKNGRLAYYIRDDGAGFDQACAGGMFRPFQRLHGQDEFPGTGIGLATVQRALDKLDGTCWAEGVTDHGATFYFTLG